MNFAISRYFHKYLVPEKKKMGVTDDCATSCGGGINSGLGSEAQCLEYNSNVIRI